MSLHQPKRRTSTRRRRFIITAGVALVVALFFTPQLLLVARFNNRVHKDMSEVPPQEYGVVFGAYVNEDRTLSDVTLERAEAAIRLYQQGIIEKVFISGDNRSNEQADVIAAYAISRGVPSEDIIVDRRGIDTHDTCRHFARIATEGILLTQEYHLPRVMYMCERDGIAGEGLAVNRLGILGERGSNPVAIWSTRAFRFVRESAMTWLFVVGLYDRMSNEAENLEMR